MLKTKNKIVHTAKYVRKSPQRVAESLSPLDKAVRDKYASYVFGDLSQYPPEMKWAVQHVPTSTIAELAVAKLFGVEIEPPGTPGYDLDTTGVELNGECYGKIEVRSRSMLRMYPGTSKEKNYFPVITRQEMVRKKDCPANWYFAVCWDSIDERLVWFRVPGGIALGTSQLDIRKGVNGNYGWADKFLWEGPC